MDDRLARSDLRILARDPLLTTMANSHAIQENSSTIESQVLKVGLFALAGYQACPAAFAMARRHSDRDKTPVV